MTHCKLFRLALIGLISLSNSLEVKSEELIPEYMQQALELAQPELKGLLKPIEAPPSQFIKALRDLRQGQGLKHALSQPEQEKVIQEFLFEAHWQSLNGNPTAQKKLDDRLKALNPAFSGLTANDAAQKLHTFGDVMQTLAQHCQSEDWQRCSEMAQNLLKLSQRQKVLAAEAILRFLIAGSQMQLGQTDKWKDHWKKSYELAHQTGMSSLVYQLQAQLVLMLDQPLLLERIKSNAQKLDDAYLMLELRKVEAELPSHLQHIKPLYLSLLKDAENLRVTPLIDHIRFRLLFLRSEHSDKEPISQEVGMSWAESLVKKYQQPRQAARLLKLYSYLAGTADYHNQSLRIHYWEQALAEAKQLKDGTVIAELLTLLAEAESNSDPVKALSRLEQAKENLLLLPVRQTANVLPQLGEKMKRLRLLVDVDKVKNEANSATTESRLSEFLELLKRSPEQIPSNAFESFLDKAPAESLRFVLEHQDEFRKSPYLITHILSFLSNHPETESAVLLKALIAHGNDYYSSQALELYRESGNADWPAMTLVYLGHLPVEQLLSEDTVNGSPVDSLLYNAEPGYIRAHQTLCQDSLLHPRPAVRYFCLRVLSDKSRPDLLPQVRSLRNDANKTIQEQATIVLANWKDPELISSLLRQDISQVQFWTEGFLNSHNSSTFYALMTLLTEEHVPQLETWLKEADKHQAPYVLMLLAAKDPYADKRLETLLKRHIGQTPQQAYGLAPVKHEYSNTEYIPLDEKEMAIDHKAAELLAEIDFSRHKALWLALQDHPNEYVGYTVKNVLSKQKDPDVQNLLVRQIEKMDDKDAFSLYHSLSGTLASEAYWNLTLRYLNSKEKALKAEAWRQAIRYIMNHNLQLLPEFLGRLDQHPDQVETVKLALRDLELKPWLSDKFVLSQFESRNLLKDALSSKYSNIPIEFIDTAGPVWFNAFNEEELIKTLEINTIHQFQLSPMRPDIKAWFENKLPQASDALKVKILDILGFHATARDDLSEVRKLLNQGSPTVASHALEMLVRTNERFESQALAKWLESSDEKVRYLASLALLQAKDQKLILKPAPVPQGSELDQRRWINLSAWAGDAAAIPQLRQLLKSSKEIIRKESLLALAALSQEQAIPDFLAALEDKSALVNQTALSILETWQMQPDVRASVYKAVAANHLPYCHAKAFLNDGQRDKVAAAYFTHYLSPVTFPRGTHIECSPYEAAREGGINFLNHWKQILTEIDLGDIWSDYRVLSYLSLLNQLKAPQWRSEAETFLSHPHPTARGQALMSLRKLPDPTLTPRFRKLAEDEDLEVRRRAWLALAAVGEKEPLPDFGKMSISEQDEEALIGWTGLALTEQPADFIKRLQGMDEDRLERNLLILAENSLYRKNLYSHFEPYLREVSTGIQLQILHALSDANGLPMIIGLLEFYEDLGRYPVMAIWQMPAERLVSDLLPVVLNTNPDDWAPHWKNAEKLSQHLATLDVSEESLQNLRPSLTNTGLQRLQLFLADRALGQDKKNQAKQILQTLLQAKDLHPILKYQAELKLLSFLPKEEALERLKKSESDILGSLNYRQRENLDAPQLTFAKFKVTWQTENMPGTKANLRGLFLLQLKDSGHVTQVSE